MAKTLKEILKIEKGAVVTLTGSGGKTSTMMALAEELKESGSVLVTTSTKIALPKADEDTCVLSSLEAYKKEGYPKKNLVLGEKIPGQEKLKGLDKEDLRDLLSAFDYVLIEGDGARRLPLKYWQPYEPIIYDFTTLALGVFPLGALGLEAGAYLIYNYQAFRDQIGDQVIGKETYKKLILSKPGPFGAFKGYKYVYINHVDREEDRQRAKDLVAYLKKDLPGINFLYGSSLKGEYYED